MGLSRGRTVLHTSPPPRPCTSFGLGDWQKKKFDTILDFCVSSLRRGHANLLCIVPILTDDLRRESTFDRRGLVLIERVSCEEMLLGMRFLARGSGCGQKADSTLRYSQAVPDPSTNRALSRLTSEVKRDPVHSTRYGRQRQLDGQADMQRNLKL